MPRGGEREGAGRPVGSQNASTYTKEQAREALRQIVLGKMQELVDAQMANATGLKYLVARQKNGKFERVSQKEVEAILAGEDQDRVTLEVWEKDPSVQAFTDLMNRALDKPKEQEQDINMLGKIEIAWLK
jgi:predicted cupin superfamily sugar epimerase